MEIAKRSLFWASEAPPSFIRSSGTYHNNYETTNNGSCLNTGIVPTATTEVEIVVRVTPGGSVVGWPYLLGAQAYNQSEDTCGVRGDNYGNATSTSIARPWAMFRWGHNGNYVGWNSAGDGTDGWSTSEAWHMIRVSKTQLVIDGEIYIATGASTEKYCSYPIAVGSINRAGSFPNCIPHDLASVKIWNSGTLVRDMAPVVNNGVAGMVNSISGSFFSSVVSGKPYAYFKK